MYSTKKNVLQVLSLLKAHEIDHIVLSPGSRNAPLTHSFSQDAYFTCFSIVDERSAAYFAIGLMEKLQKPVAICCTSGTALLNYAPAVAEAFYRNLPLVVLSADRAEAWIGQMDGQTLPQQTVFGQLVRMSVQIPEIHTKEEEWLCNRRINEALMECRRGESGPVHLNIPISEPLFDFSEKDLPVVRTIRSHTSNSCPDMESFLKQWNSFSKRMILVGQMQAGHSLTEVLERLVSEGDCVVLCEHLSNTTSRHFIGNFDALLTTAGSNPGMYAPELLITLGGHVVSKRIKQFLRTNTPKAHWHLGLESNCADTYQCLTDQLVTCPEAFLQQLTISNEKPTDFSKTWKSASAQIPYPKVNPGFSDLSVVGSFLRRLPEKSSLFVGNSSSVRNIQLYPLPETTSVFCNRGTNGIEGSISTASGYACLHQGLTFLLLGDLSFFYDLNGLWNKYLGANLRLLLINNDGGGIFHLLPGLNQSEALEPYIAAQHQTRAEKWVEAAGLDYACASNENELQAGLAMLMDEKAKKAFVLEVLTDPETNKSVFNSYYEQLKTTTYV